MEIKAKISALREAMSKEGVKAYIIPSADAHLSEYTPERWKGRAWISGFDGSAGTVVVTDKKAGLWTDSRYFLQAESDLKGSEIELFKMGMPGVISIEEFLLQELNQGDIAACDGNCYAHTDAEETRSQLSQKNIKLRTDIDLFTEIWKDRPSIPAEKIFTHPDKYAGKSVKQKIETVLDKLHKKGCNATIMTMLDEVAWAFNIRGYDVPFNPVAVVYGYISDKESILFVLPHKIDKDVIAHLEAEGVKVKDYHEIVSYLGQLGQEVKLFVDPKRISEAIFEAIPQHCQKIYGVSIVTMLKAVKNDVEIKGLRDVMERDGVALTRFFMWLEKVLKEGATPSEVEIGEKLASFRAQDEQYYGDSFDTIAGYQAHGAIVHYSAKPETAFNLKAEGVLLLDSGGQYKDGTTDITRTLALSAPGADLKKDYTLVMKGHIGIATAQYPEGTRGGQLDILARKALWDEGLNYGHGTGHGVGCFLNVHEGPQNIRTEINPTVLEPGMITSNEPGLYRAGKYGIRIENLVVTRLNTETEFGKFFGFETLTMCYFDNNLIEKSLLTESEIKWYNDYQKTVYDRLSPRLNKEEAEWLKAKTAAI
nr:aminopeptidase P family protein [Porphyromonas pogonae]